MHDGLLVPLGAVPESVAVPEAPGQPNVTNAGTGLARFKPAPPKPDIMILPLLGITIAGVSVTVIVTPVAPLTLLLRVIES